VRAAAERSPRKARTSTKWRRLQQSEEITTACSSVRCRREHDAEQLALTDPALRWQADEGRKVSMLDYQGC
jgi:hypothetical protein